VANSTPGPWDASGLTVYDTCLDEVASTHTAADARLIAAAPDLLEALEAIERYLRQTPHHNALEAAAARAAIRKAKGEAQ
jgi:hypothetical protein